MTNQASAAVAISRLGQARYRKPIGEIRAEASQQGLKRHLTARQIMLIGVGGIIGAGVFVMTGNAAASFAGPAVILSYVIAGIACGLTALCYAELASIIPASGSSYTYCYASLGEGAAWMLAWILLFDYSLAGALVGVGFAGYLTSLLADFGLFVPAVLAAPLVQTLPGTGSTGLFMAGSVNLVAATAIMIAALALSRGIETSASINAAFVAIKLSVLLIFVVAGLHAIDPGNWRPFIPPHEGGFAFGWPGVIRAASILFYAYLGFETISTTASEARDPQRDMPLGILGALAICTLIYVVVAAVLVGVAPYRELGVADPIARALDRMDMPLIARLVKVGAVTGLASVLLVNAYGQSRICFAMSRDGLLPGVFGRLNAQRASPVAGVMLLGGISALLAALLPIQILGDLISVGTGFAFSVVCVALMWLRSVEPDLPRPFRVPLGGFRIGRVWIGIVPTAALLMCWAMILPVLIDILSQAGAGHVLPAMILGCWLLAGILFYLAFGLRRSRRVQTRQADETDIARPEAG
ncbi:amino acid permease [Sandaracinobacter neustonicus]|uniref:Amino acid permease n=1 Tax=Sandaracinobacter neustonicus TaxID=1715348 RepID=A0A501XIK6_9SPHN|nr:amino acid permease [Sandaracinobacter neustonicus]TPE60498.1 amino acid permease [Sandaracinobacter neustonicus]